MPCPPWFRVARRICHLFQVISRGRLVIGSDCFMIYWMMCDLVCPIHQRSSEDQSSCSHSESCMAHLLLQQDAIDWKVKCRCKSITGKHEEGSGVDQHNADVYVRVACYHHSSPILYGMARGYVRGRMLMDLHLVAISWSGHDSWTHFYPARHITEMHQTQKRQEGTWWTSLSTQYDNHHHWQSLFSGRSFIE